MSKPPDMNKFDEIILIQIMPIEIINDGLECKKSEFIKPISINFILNPQIRSFWTPPNSYSSFYRSMWKFHTSFPEKIWINMSSDLFWSIGLRLIKFPEEGSFGRETDGMEGAFWTEPFCLRICLSQIDRSSWRWERTKTFVVCLILTS